MTNRFVIVGSGMSAKGFVPPDSAYVIAVNGAIDWLSRADYWFTLDASPENIRRMHNRRTGTKYFAAVPDNIKTPFGISRLKRNSASANKFVRPISAADCYLRFGCIGELSDVPTEINTGNSVWGALQLARHLGAHKVLLVGVDADNNKKIDGKRPNRLDHLPILFSGAVGKIDFANVGKMQVEGMPRFDNHDEGIKWLMQ